MESVWKVSMGCPNGKLVVRTGKVRVCQVQGGQVRTGQVKTDQVGTGQVKSGLSELSIFWTQQFLY